MNRYIEMFKSLVAEIDKVKLSLTEVDSPAFIRWKRNLLSVSRKLMGEDSADYRETEKFFNTRIADYNSDPTWGYQFLMEQLRAFLEAVVWEYEMLGDSKIKEQSIKIITDKRKETIKNVILENTYFVAHEYVR